MTGRRTPTGRASRSKARRSRYVGHLDGAAVFAVGSLADLEADCRNRHLPRRVVGARWGGTWLYAWRGDELVCLADLAVLAAELEARAGGIDGACTSAVASRLRAALGARDAHGTGSADLADAGRPGPIFGAPPEPPARALGRGGRR